MQVLQKLLTCCLLCIAGLRVCAQDIPHIRHFLPAEYGGQNQNWSLAQSDAGWIYAGNNSGLLEYDGAEFQLYHLPERQTVRALATGPNGMIFCGGVAEFGFWKPDATGRLEYTPLGNELPADQLGKEEIWHIVVQPDFVLFQSFSTIYKYDYQKVTVVKPPGSIMFARVVQDRVFVPVIGQGLFELIEGQTFQFVAGTEVLKDKFVQFMIQGKEGVVWAGTTSDGIFVLKDGQCKPWAHPLNAEFRKYQLNKAIRLADGGWAIGTILNGAYILDEQEQLRFHIYRENGLQNNTILALMQDRSGNLWLGMDRGLDCVELGSPVHVFEDQNGQIGTIYTAVAWKGQMFVGSNQGVFVRDLTPYTAPSVRQDFRLIEGTQGQVWQLQVFDNQLICGHNTGTFTIENGVARTISDVTGGWCTISVPNRPDLLLQSTYTGLIVFKKDASNRWQFSHRIRGFSESLRKIVFDANGAIWGSHPNKGLFQLHFDPNLAAVTSAKTFTHADGLPTEYKLDLSTFQSGLLLNTATAPLRIQQDPQRGSVFEPLDDSFKGKKVFSGIGGDYFTTDSSGVWLETQQNTWFFPFSLVPFYENIVPISEGQYLFCLESGFAVLDKKRMASNQSQQLPNPVIRRIVTPSGEVYAAIDRCEFDWQHNDLKFCFAVPFYTRAPHYAWRLEGFSDQWSPWQTSPEKEFTNLPEGTYTFWVRTDLGGVPARLQFVICAPWYRSAAAWFCYVMALLVVGFGIEKLYQIRLLRQRQLLEANAERELARARTEGERARLQLEVDNRNSELSNAAFNLIRKNEALQALKDELIDLSKDTQAVQKIIRHIDEHLEGDHDWAFFETSFNRVHDDFTKRLLVHTPELTPGDLRLAAYLKMNLSSKEIAPLFNISIRGVENKRYRLRKKLGLPEDANLTEFMLNF